MADFADDAAEVTEMNLQVALQNARGLARNHQGAFCPGDPNAYVHTLYRDSKDETTEKH